MDYKKLIDKLEELHRSDELIDDKLGAFCNAISSDIYNMFCSQNQAEAFLSAIKIINPEIEDWLSYYLYEAKNMEKAIMETKDGKKYNAKDKKEFIKFLTEEL